MPPEFITPAELLRLADAHLRSLQPAQRAHFHHWGRAYRVRWDYPGRVLVFDAASGVLVARSQPGRPTQPAKLRVAAHAARR